MIIKVKSEVPPRGLFRETANNNNPLQTPLPPRVNMGHLTSFLCITPGKVSGVAWQRGAEAAFRRSTLVALWKSTMLDLFLQVITVMPVRKSVRMKYYG